MGTAAGLLRNFREQFTQAIAESDAAIRTMQAKLDEERAENERLRKIVAADGIVYEGAGIRLMDSVAGVEDDDEAEAA